MLTEYTHSPLVCPVCGSSRVVIGSPMGPYVPVADEQPGADPNTMHFVFSPLWRDEQCLACRHLWRINLNPSDPKGPLMPLPTAAEYTEYQPQPKPQFHYASDIFVQYTAPTLEDPYWTCCATVRGVGVTDDGTGLSGSGTGRSRKKAFAYALEALAEAAVL